MSLPLSVSAAIRARRSTKQFESRPIPDEVIAELIDLTIAAPSSFNLQPWRIVLARSDATRAALTKAAFGQPQVRTAPLTLVFAVSLEGWQQDFDSVLTQAADRGAWNARTVEVFRRTVPQFQADLRARDRLREYAIKDAMIAATHAALAAEASGLSSCFMNGWDEDAVRSAIGAPGDPDIAIAVLLALGYAPASGDSGPGRLPTARTVFTDRL